MLKNILIIAVALMALIACNTTPADNAETAGQEDTAQHDHEGHDHGDDTAAQGDGKHFGETITEDGAISYEAMLTKMGEADSIPAKVVGKVSAVCQAKGCWMNIVSEDSDQPQEMFVQFKDYGFFMPKDIAGRKVIMDGYAYRDVTSVEDLKHFAQDEGKSQEEIDAITEPVEELKFLASGVILLDEEEMK